MSLGPFLLALASAALIIAGVIVTWRDVRAKRSSASMAEPYAPPTRTTAMRTAMPPATTIVEARDTRDTGSSQRFTETNADVTIVRREAKPEGLRAAGAAPGSAFAALQSAVTAITSEAAADVADIGVEGQRWPTVENRWPIIDNEIEQAVVRLNAALAPVALQIGPAGEAGWSFKNRGYGSYRRIAIGGRSVAWLRCETNPEQTISMKVRAHAVEQALLNATTSLSATGADAVQMLEALSVCMRPAAEYAAWAVPKQPADAETGRDAWSDLGVLTTEAFTIASGALREADAALSEVSRPAWDPATGHTRWALAVAVGGTRAADIAVDLVKRQFEIVSQPARGLPTDLGRKRRLDLADLTAHALAEAIASSAWPAVASALEQPVQDP